MITKTGLKRFLKNLSLLVFILLICFLAVEFSLRITEKNNPGAIVKFPEIIKPLNNHELYYELIPNIKEYRFKNTTISTNSEGFRDYEYPIEKPENTYRIAMIGDSVTFGWGVNLKDTYAKQLENKLKSRSDYKYEVLNFGIPGYYTDQELNLVKKNVLTYNPDMIILTYVFNDAEIAPRYNLDKKVFLYRQTIQRLKYKSYTFSFLFYNYAKVRELFKEKSTTDEQDYKAYLEGVFSDNSQGWNISKNSLKKIKQISDENNIDFLIILFPSIKPNDLQDYQLKNIHETIASFAEENDINYLDLLPYFLTHKDTKLELDIDAHPNEFTHHIIADILTNTINPNNTFK